MDTQNKPYNELLDEIALLKSQVAILKKEQDSSRQAVALLVQMQEAMQYSNLAVTAQMELRTMLESILTLLYRLLNTYTAQIYLVDDGHLSFGAFLRKGKPLSESLSPPRQHGLTNTVALTGERIIVDDVLDHPLYNDIETTYHASSRSLIGIPLLLGRQVLGVMTVGFKEPNSITPLMTDQLEAFAMQAAIAIENARLYRLSQDKNEQDRRYYEELNRTKNLVMDMVSHDLKNPIGVIKGYVAVLRKHGHTDTDTGQNALNQIENGANLMLDLVTDLLDLARLETGLALHREVVELNALVEQSLFQHELNATQKAIEMLLDISTDHLNVFLDPKRMSQVLSNIVSNAIKYTPAGGSVVVSTQQDGEWAYIRISDSGLGIPEKDLPHIFEKFHRVKSDAHAEIEGTGLGLAIVKSIVDQHHGIIRVDSRYGEGSTFTIQLPLQVKPIADDPESTKDLKPLPDNLD